MQRRRPRAVGPDGNAHFLKELEFRLGDCNLLWTLPPRFAPNRLSLSDDFMLNTMRGFCELESLLRQLGTPLDDLTNLFLERPGNMSDHHGDPSDAIWDMLKETSDHGIRFEIEKSLSLEVG